MSLDADLIVDRRRMRRKLTFWRIVAFALIILAIAGAAMFGSNRLGLTGVRPYIARVTIQGLIRDDQDRVAALDRLARSSLARAVIVHVDSPGGTTAGSEQLFNSLSQVRDKKPLVIVVDSLAASGGYITALAGDHIVAQQTSLVGSIGVLFQFPNVSDLLDKLGVKMESIKSTPLKAAPDGFEPTSPEARAAINAIIQDSIPGSKGWCRIAGTSPTISSRRLTMAGCSPGIRESITSWSTSSAMSVRRWPGSVRTRMSIPSCRFATISCAAG